MVEVLIVDFILHDVTYILYTTLIHFNVLYVPFIVYHDVFILNFDFVENVPASCYEYRKKHNCLPVSLIK